MYKILHFVFFFVILCMTIFPATFTKSYSANNTQQNDFVEYFDSISGLFFFFPDTPVYERTRSKDLNSYSLTYSKPGTSYIVIVEKVEMPEDLEETLRNSFNAVLDNRSIVLDKKYIKLPIPHLSGLIHGRYELFVHFQSFYYNEFFVRQMLTNLGSKKEKDIVERFFLTVKKL